MGWVGSDFQRTHNFSADASAGINIVASRFDAEFDNFETGLEACLKLDGTNNPAADFPMGGFKHTNVGAAASINQYLRLDQLQQQTPIFCSFGGDADVISVSTYPTYAALVTGHTIIVSCPSANTTTSVVIKLNGLSSRPVVRPDGSPLGYGDVLGLRRYTYIGTKFVIENPKTGTFHDAEIHSGSVVFTSVVEFSGSVSFSSAASIFDGAAQYPIGYRGIPVVTLDAGRGISANDSAKMLYHSSTGTAPIRVRSSASVAYALGTAILIQNGPSAGVVSVSAYPGVTLFRSGTGSTGTRILSAGCDALLRKVADDTWAISGNGLT